MQKVLIDSNNIIHFGKHSFFGPEVDIDDALYDYKTYNKKSYIYPNGLIKSVFCNTWTFRVNIPKSKKSGFISPPFPSYDKFKNSLTRIPFTSKTSREKERENEKRACRRIEDIIYLNTDLKNYITLTFDLLKVNSSDKELVSFKLENWLKNQVYRKGLKYVLVPEYHKKDAKIHFHGFVNNSLEMVDSGTRRVRGFSKPVKVTKIQKWLRIGKITQEDILDIVYNLPEWGYGFSTSFSLEKTPQNIVSYITKYITKDASGVNKILGKRYWSSRNLEVYPPVLLENVSPDLFDSLPYKEYFSPYDEKSYKYYTNILNRVE